MSRKKNQMAKNQIKYEKKISQTVHLVAKKKKSKRL